MPNWGETDILGASSGGGTATGQGNPAVDYLRQLLGQGPSQGPGATTNAATGPYPSPNAPGTNPMPMPNNAPVTTPPQPGPGQAPGPTTATAQAQQAATPGGPPNPRDRWQGGQADPNGTQAPNGRQTGGRYVDPTYQTDANGKPLSAQDQAYWRQYDVNRANASTAEQARYQAYKANQAKSTNTTGNVVYDPITQTYSILNDKGEWKSGVAKADLAAQMPDNIKKQYPDWWWGQYSSQQDLGRRQEVEAGAFDAQKFASMGATSTRYSATNF